MVTTHGTVTAGTVVRATEAYTTELPGEGRRFLPLYSLMVATEPLSPAMWDELGWSGRETISDQHHLFFYAQRTMDDRIAIGGRGAPYKLGQPIREDYERRAEVRARLTASIQRHFSPAGAGRDHASLGRAARRAARLVHVGGARPRGRLRAGPAATPGTASWPRTSPAARSPT